MEFDLMNDYVFHEEPETGAIVVNGIGRYKGWFYSAMRNTVLWTRPEDRLLRDLLV